MTAEADDRVVRQVLGFAGGLVTGVVLGLVFAPAPGRDTRRWIATQSGNAYRRAAPFLHPHQMRAIIRERGVRGLLQTLQRERENAASDPEQSAVHPA